MPIDNLDDLWKNINERILLGDSVRSCMKILSQYNGQDYKQYVYVNHLKYNRFIYKKTDKLEMVIVTWDKSQSSGFHGHPGECIYKLLMGDITEFLKSKETKEIEQTELYVGDVGYIDNNIGYHNMFSVDGAVSLHIYSPPF